MRPLAFITVHLLFVIMSGYLFRVSSPATGTYTETYHNDPSGNYWKTVSEAQAIVKAKAPSGAQVDYMGYA